MATDDGVSRFDGVDFRTYGMRDGLSYPAINSICEGSGQRLWAGTREGLCWLDLTRRGTAQRWHRVELPGGDLANQISIVRSDSKGNLWAAAPTHLFIHHRAAPVGAFDEVVLPSDEGGFPPLIINDLAAGRGGVVWISTSRGLFRHLPDGTISRVEFHGLGLGHGSETGMITVAPDGVLWVHGLRGLLLRVG
ncbi:MAG TPA: hypothetical protein VKA53_02710, partial [Thermoanaerobaculia bacterium]|nr:hypothetical protein [Thermoanaerobaculia bacterium]